MGHLKIFKKKSQGAEKNQKGGDPLVSAGFVGYVKKVKNERRDTLETKKIQKKVAQCRKKSKKSLVPSGFVGYLEKVKIERGTLCTKFALAHWADLAP